jgi:hypothetical protein
MTRRKRRTWMRTPTALTIPPPAPKTTTKTGNP